MTRAAVAALLTRARSQFAASIRKEGLTRQDAAIWFRAKVTQHAWFGRLSEETQRDLCLGLAGLVIDDLEESAKGPSA